MKKPIKRLAVIVMSVLLVVMPSLTLTASAVTGSEIVNFASQFDGYPYVYGAAGPYSFDCSGFVKYVFANFGIYLPHGTSYFWNSPTSYGTLIGENTTANAKPGDVISWPGHMGIYTGDGYCINALNENAGVCYIKVNSFCDANWNPQPYRVIRIYGCSEHTCSYSSSVTKAATCNATGVRTYTCSCGKSYTESIAKNPNNHAGGTVIKNAVAATTTSTGYTGDTYCKGCNALLQYGKTIPKVDETQWVYVTALPSHVTTQKYEIEYKNVYKKVATVAPDSSWTKGTLAKTEYVNDGGTYESDFPLSTSDTRVLSSYYYYHWCGSSTGNYVNFAYTDSMNHYDAYYETNAVIEERSVADSDDSRYTAYMLAWAHDPSGHCYCAPALTCDSSNSHTTRSCWWYKRYIYQDKKAVKYYNFTKESGWSSEKDSSANEVEYRYKLKDNYTVTYNSNGGSGVPASQTKTAGQSLTLSTVKPSRTGYTFKCWNTKADGSGTAYYPGGTYSANASVTLYAQWTVNKQQFKVTYNGNGGTPVVPYEYVEEGHTTTLPIAFKYFKITYNANGGVNPPSEESARVDCLGWSTSSSATTATYKCDAAYKATADVTLYAVWAKSAQMNLSVQQPVRDGYVFLGWSENPNATQADFSAGASVDVSGNATLYAVWGEEVVDDGYEWWEWLIIIFLFGWIWYI